MPRFFVRSSAVSDKTVTISGDDARHIGLSLRMRIGEKITVCDMQKNVYDCEITEISIDTVLCNILSRSVISTEPPYNVRLFQALPKGDKMDYIVQKAVELGVGEIIPVVTERSVVKLDAQSAEKKTERWRKISASAAGQCGRGMIPAVSKPVDFKTAVGEASENGLGFLCYEGDGSVPLNRIIEIGTYSDISFIIGPEGGFSLNEVEVARRSGIAIAGLGKRILRCETASGFVLSCLAYEKEIKVLE